MMNLKFFINVILVMAALLVCKKSLAFAEGDQVILSSIFKRNDLVELALQKGKYYSYRSDKQYRSKKMTDWWVVLKDKKGNNIDSTYLKFEHIGASIGVSVSSANVSGDAGSKPKLVKILSSDEAYDTADFVSKQTDAAYKVELYFKGKLKASALVNELK